MSGLVLFFLVLFSSFSLFFFSSVNLDNSMRRVAICCIEHALLLVSSVDVALDEDAQATLNTFTTYRDKLKDHLTSQNALKTPVSPNSLSRAGSRNDSFSQLPSIGEKAAEKTGTYSNHYNYNYIKYHQLHNWYHPLLLICSLN